MENTNYITIQGWMVKELKLKGNELLTFALIYGFTQDGESRFQGSCAYIADWLGSSRQTALNMLNLLTNKGLIIRNEKTVNGLKVCDYAVNCAILATVQNFNTIYISNNNTLIDKDNLDNNTDNYGVQNLYNCPKCADECASDEEPKVESFETRDQRNARTFDFFWKTYPRKVDKERARRAWNKLSPNSQMTDIIMQALVKQKQAGILLNDSYTPYPATWLNGRRWDDIIVPKTSRNSSQAIPAPEDYLTDGDAIICSTSEDST